MTFRQMELFIAVCEYKSINKASEAHFISQQGVSKMIRELEDELDCTLLERTKNGVTPTPRGTYFLQECRTIVEKKAFLCDNISKMKEFPKEIIHLGMAFGMIAAIPYKLLLDFEREHPHIRIDYADHADFYLENLLLKGDYDFSITTGIMDEERLVAEKAFHEPTYLCIPQNHPLYNQETITMEDLKHQKFVAFSTKFHIRHNFVASCRRYGFEPNIELSSGDFNSLKEIAKANDFLFVVPAHTVNTDDVGLRYHPFPDKNFVWTIYFARKKNMELSENGMLFYRYLMEGVPRLFD